MREVLSGRGLREKTQTPFIPYRIPTGVPMRVGFGICKDCGDAGRFKYGAGSNMGPGHPEVKGDAARLKYEARRSR